MLLDQDGDCEWTLDIEEKNLFKNGTLDNLNTIGDYSFDSYEEKRNSVTAPVNNNKLRIN